ncbi:maleylpyruvate isomerase N-terminal domain-containing protein [Haloglycomyces albus]|uniref:maleylpyruvate isomerase N-terminal domain-containing protein n=1 Tax=Haloglycomyces albus TaxID=526067 RepID=UPI00046D0953|nr:maleylpyruvate isomerase N-terminal domain-containing protein [Haloglycomyces albus]
MSPITDYVAVIRDEAAEMLGALTDSDISAALPSRPGQTIADALVELAAVYDWTSDILTTGHNGHPEEREVNPTSAVADFRTSELRLLRTFAEHPAASPAWSWSPVSDKAIFWYRRCAVITALARWDVQMAEGTTAPLEQAIAVATIEEALDSFLPTGRGLHPHPHGEGLVQLFAQDADRSWFGRFHGGTIAILSEEPRHDSSLQARVAGSASDLALALHGRLPFGITDCIGDEKLLQNLRVE